MDEFELFGQWYSTQKWFPMDVLNRIARKAMDMAPFWKTHASAAPIFEAILNTYNYTWDGNWHHTPMISAAALLATDKAYRERISLPVSHMPDASDRPLTELAAMAKAQKENLGGADKENKDKNLTQAKNSGKTGEATKSITKEVAGTEVSSAAFGMAPARASG